MKRLFIALALAAVALGASPSQAKSHFAAYEGKDAVQEGQGGTRITKNGIDYWSYGSPPRKFKVLGVITDKRCLGGHTCGDAIGSKAVADAAKSNGGDAVILLGQQNDIRGSVVGGTATGGANFASGTGWAIPVGNRVAQLLVVKYLAEDAEKP